MSNWELRIVHLVAKKSAVVQLQQVQEFADSLRLHSIAAKMEEILEVLQRRHLDTGGVHLCDNLVVSHRKTRCLKKYCRDNFLNEMLLKCMKRAAIAMHEAVAACVVCEHRFPVEKEFIRNILVAYGEFSAEEKQGDLMAQLIKGYHQVFGHTAAAAFPSKSSLDNTRRGRVRPRRPRTEVNTAGGDSGDQGVFDMLDETMNVTKIPPEEVYSVFGEPLVLELNSVMVPECITASVSRLVPCSSQPVLDSGELFLAESRYEPIELIQRARVTSGQSITIKSDCGISYLTDSAIAEGASLRSLTDSASSSTSSVEMKIQKIKLQLQKHQLAHLIARALGPNIIAPYSSQR